MTSLLAGMSTALLVAGISYAGRRKPGYSHLQHTISELGETDSPVARLVNYGLFLPVGVLLFGLAASTDYTALRGLATCVGVGYVVAASFPCDPGSPLSGSSRQQIHNLGGAVEYIGGAYFLSQLTPEHTFLGQHLFTIAAGVVGALAVLLSVPGLPIRGLVQRIAEVVLFGTLTAVA